MHWSEVLFGSLLVVILLALALAYGWRQWRALRRLGEGTTLPDEELRYERRKARRRLASSAVLLVMAVLLTVLLAVFGDQAQRVADASEQAGAGPREKTPEEVLFLRLWGGTLIAFLVALLVALALAAIDLIETRRYGLRQYRKLQAERRAMIQRQAIRLREERQGDG